MSDEIEPVEPETFAEGLTPEQLLPGQDPYVDPPVMSEMEARLRANNPELAARLDAPPDRTHRREVSVYGTVRIGDGTGEPVVLPTASDSLKGFKGVGWIDEDGEMHFLGDNDE